MCYEYFYKTKLYLLIRFIKVFHYLQRCRIKVLNVFTPCWVAFYKILVILKKCTYNYFLTELAAHFKVDAHIYGSFSITNDVKGVRGGVITWMVHDYGQ